MNNVSIIGRLGADPETRYTPDGKAIAKFSLAVQRNKEHVDWFDVVCFEKTAETVQGWGSKGRQVAISGRLQQDRWERDGKKFSKVVLVAGNVQFLGPNPNAESGSSNGQQSSYGSFGDELSPDEIPF